MKKLIEWHKNYYYGLLEKWNVSSYQIAWLSWCKGIVFGIIIMLLASCSTYQLLPKDEFYFPYIFLQIPFLYSNEIHLFSLE